MHTVEALEETAGIRHGMAFCGAPGRTYTLEAPVLPAAEVNLDLYGARRRAGLQDNGQIGTEGAEENPRSAPSNPEQSGHRKSAD